MNASPGVILKLQERSLASERRSHPPTPPRLQETWFWGLTFEFQLPGRKGYGHTGSLDEAKAAFKAEYEAWKSCTG
jgi:hypothetical protein